MVEGERGWEVWTVCFGHNGSRMRRLAAGWNTWDAGRWDPRARCVAADLQTGWERWCVCELEGE
jgi:hypothetical protein